MKKKFISIETKVNDEVVDALCVPQASMNSLGAVLELAPVGANIIVSVQEMEIPEMPNGLQGSPRN